MQVTGRRWKKQHRLNFATKKNMEEVRSRRDRYMSTGRKHRQLQRPGVFQPWERGRKLQLLLLLPCMLRSGFPAGDRGKAGVLGMHCTSLC